ncbi:MAG: Fe-S cluster assembly ATPase SufC [Candidatus Lloydbacteria bacterium CG22_combo_CG10-13_8_21_14_all_47_15]|uniref:Fe-S cluster assembly ATPase SufC n=1 Tax=Candidatus Lloydbacteria bacterium CG22_combo_CG10-13_8_21_14_all_47_15 TaxID=1974635 RepID=A0A2H0CSZ3_9BACT|nr:MAG: Fe-S cluster assembly ATPase SufC [Candidatus Lloydbacteria bacterium CG22_combo_CG10-13_8_21_14_all_47_15]
MSLIFDTISIAREGRSIVRDVSFAIPRGELHILMGQNGSGKSTLLNGSMGYPSHTISRGKILLDGEDVTGFPTEEKAKKGLFLSPQNPPAIPGVPLASFLYKASSALHGTAESALDFYARAESIAEQFGLDAMLLKRPVHEGLSGGEKKHAELIQLAILEPKFAMLDEIDSGLDRDSLRLVFKTIDAFRKRGMGFLVVTHYDTILDISAPDAVHVMYGGKIVRSGGTDLAREIKEQGYTQLVCKK